MGAPKMEVLRGPASSGKTQALVERAAQLVGQGAAPADVLVVAPNPDAALELSVRLGERLSGEAPRVVDGRLLAWELAGRPRVLGAPERSLLLADLRAAGFSAAEVSRALSSAQGAWAQGVRPQASDACLQALLEGLAELDAVLPEALAACALAGVDEPDRVARVLVDDADAQPASVLRLACALAREDVFLAGNACQAACPPEGAPAAHDAAHNPAQQRDCASASEGAPAAHDDATGDACQAACPPEGILTAHDVACGPTRQRDCANGPEDVPAAQGVAHDPMRQCDCMGGSEGAPAAHDAVPDTNRQRDCMSAPEGAPASRGSACDSAPRRDHSVLEGAPVSWDFAALAGSGAQAQAVHELPAPARRVHAVRSQAVKWADPDEEAAGLAALVDRTLGQAGAGEGPVVLVAPNRAWARRLCQALDRAGIEACDAGCAQALACDPRDPHACAPLRAFAALGLVADPGDAASWRAWCALGHADLACASWRNLRVFARQRHLGVVEALHVACGQVEAGEAPFPGARQLAARVREARGLVGSPALSKRGRALLDAVDPAGTPVFRRLFCLPEDDLAGLDARGLFREALSATFTQSLGMNPCDARGARLQPGAPVEAGRRVYVCLPQALVGVRPRLLVVAGANEGLFEGDALTRVLSMQADGLVVSYVQRMPEQAARRVGASFRRTRVEGGQAVALLRPADALEALGSEAPATMGGQQFCSAVLGVRP